MSAAHTPAPWRVWDESAPEVFPVGGGSRIALCSSDTNARLIAAAPELLAALQALIDLVPDYVDGRNDEAIEAAEAAIAKATGVAT